MGLVKASSEKTRQPAAPLIAQAPRPASRQDRRRADAQARPAPARELAPRRRLRRPPPAEPAAMQLPPQQPSAPAVEIARVRSVLVAPRATGPGSRTGAASSASHRSAERRGSLADAPHWTTAANLAPATSPPAATAGQARPVHRTSPSCAAPRPRPSTQQAAKLARGEPPVAAPVDDRCAAPPGARPHQGGGGRDTARAGAACAGLPDPDRRLPERGRGRAPAGGGARARRRPAGQPARP